MAYVRVVRASNKYQTQILFGSMRLKLYLTLFEFILDLGRLYNVQILIYILFQLEEYKL